MKRLTKLILVFFAAQCAAVAANAEKTMDINVLPANAKQVVTQHFGDKAIRYVEVTRFAISTPYEVKFEDGTEIEFDSKGEWKEIKARATGIPEALLPQQIRDYVSGNYKDVKVVEIERKRRGGFDIELNNGLELEFDKNMALVDIDS